MAQRAKAFSNNAPGAFFVDQTCIDCGTCYQFAPGVFEDSRGHSRVHHQPLNDEERLRASQALLACPTASIGSDDKAGMTEATQSFPHRIHENVFFCGFTSEKSFGAWSYLIQREEGNVLMDSPRAAPPLLKRIESLGGLKWMLLSHQDDVADHGIIHERFGCERIMHVDDRLSGLERYLKGEDPIALDDDWLAIPTPGHSAGSTCFLYKEKYLFSGDHLWWNPHKQRLSASKSYAWHSWDLQLKSLEKLLAFDFEWVLPGHGYMHHEASPAAMRKTLEQSIKELRTL
jgi:glyoxylase-like metal-dependent hydrolase (beta-lactamase superfamily II)/ferredoxin